MRQIRAKFRCLSVTEKWNGEFVGEFSPVMQKGENSEENKKFWKYTPAGEAELTFHEEHDLQVGAYYYIDMVADDDGEWSLSSVTKDGHRDQGRTGGKVALSYYRSHDYRDVPKGLLRGSLEMQLSGEANGTLDLFGEAGGRWKVTFTFAEPSDD
jgi:hypothetical protein